MKYTLCRHIKTNGTRCQAPSLTDGIWCYFHSRLHQSHKRFRHNDATRGYLIPGQHIELNTLEDRESVQVALSVVINALATGNLDTRRATALLYGLQLASNNAASLNTKPYAPKVVRDVEPGPDGLDLAQPGATIEVSEDYDPNADLALDEDEEEDEDDDDVMSRLASLDLHGSSENEPSSETEPSSANEPSGSQRERMGVELCQPAGKVELPAGQIAGGDQAQDSVLQVGVKLREGVARTGAGDRLKLVQAQAVVEGDRRSRSIDLGLAGARSKAGVQTASRITRARMRQKQRDRLQRSELTGVQVLRDIKGAAVDEPFQPDNRRRVSCSAQSRCSQLFGVDGHDTTLLLFRALHIKTSLAIDWTPGERGKAEK
ncbi:hypothetical protein [Tunturibacter empetritectus]|uniref:Uncharacterized protein n=1 Tax=Tunturiibacter lichenicola TaxID=2051959 RepID=A0A7W8JBW5_9BACT|nr:hypothetical protein [Edaphobacter lichenicola]MBB5346106.1 hypothetical protein [Edaphobacter lichenicola]